MKGGGKHTSFRGFPIANSLMTVKEIACHIATSGGSTNLHSWMGVLGA